MDKVFKDTIGKVFKDPIGNSIEVYIDDIPKHRWVEEWMRDCRIVFGE